MLEVPGRRSSLDAGSALNPVPHPVISSVRSRHAGEVGLFGDLPVLPAAVACASIVNAAVAGLDPICGNFSLLHHAEKNARCPAIRNGLRVPGGERIKT